MDKTSSFEGWAVVEVMGHQKHAGYVTTEIFGSTTMFRIVAPEMSPVEEVLTSDRWLAGAHCPAGSRIQLTRPRSEHLVGAASIYRITPCPEERALSVLPVEVTVLERAPGNFRALPAGPIGDPDGGEFDVEELR